MLRIRIRPFGKLRIRRSGPLAGNGGTSLSLRGRLFFARYESVSERIASTLDLSVAEQIVVNQITFPMAKSSKAKNSKNTKSTILFGFAERQRGPSGKWRVRFLVGRILAFLGIVTLLAYFGFHALLFLHYRVNRGYSEVTFSRILALPFTQKEFRRERGEFHLKRARQYYDEGAFGKAFGEYSVGVALAPDNLEGRMRLSEFLMATKDTDRAIRVLSQGLRFGMNDPEYIGRYLAALFAFQRDYEIIEIANEILAAEPSDEMRKLVALASARAHYYRGAYDESEDIIQTHKLDAEPDGLLLAVNINWLRGQKDVAVERLENALREFQSKDPFYRRLVEYCIEIGDLSRANRYAVMRNLNAPLSIEPRIDLLFVESKREDSDEEKIRRDAMKILQQFKNNESALLALANFAANSGETAVATRIYETALENGFDVGPFALLVIESYISGNEFGEAVAFSEELAEEGPDWLDSTQTADVFASLRSVAYYGVGNTDLSDLYVDQFLKNPNLRPSVHLAVAKRLQELGALQQARKVLEFAYRKNPENQNALTQLVAIELELGNSTQVGPYLKRLLRMRRPAVEVLQEAYESLGSDRFIFTPDRETILIELRSLIRGDLPIDPETPA